jgi:L-fuconolactonase
LVQLLGQYANDYQQACCKQQPDRFVSIAGVDWTTEMAVDELHRLSDDGALGIRLRPGSRSPGDDPLAIWNAASERGLIVSCVGTAAQFADPSFAALATELPSLLIVLEHLGGLGRPDVGDTAAALSGIANLARFSTISLKLPGLGQLLPRSALAKPPTSLEDARDTPIDAMLAAFGPGRMMWASDFPVVSTREGYANALSWVGAVLPPESRAAIFGGNANALTTSA